VESKKSEKSGKLGSQGSRGKTFCTRVSKMSLAGVQNAGARFAGVESGKQEKLKVGESGRVSRVSKMTKLSFVNEKLNWTSYTHSPAGVMSRIGLTGVQNGNRRRGIGTGYDGT